MHKACSLIVVALAACTMPLGDYRAQASSNSDEKWKEALSPHSFSFPRDHGAHPDYRVEWWYYTGNLRSRDGTELGYQLTFFRSGVRKTPQSESRWALRDLHLAHFAVSDLGAKRFRSAERIRRRGIGWAGSEVKSETVRVWNGDWKVEISGNTHVLQAQHDDMKIALALSAIKPVVLHGEAGLSRKGADEGNASHYYSLPRLKTSGSVTLGDTEHIVSGSSWMDHEFGTTFLQTKQVGWDWFSLQFDDGSELMLFQLRTEAGGASPESSGTWIERDGKSTHIKSEAFTLTPKRSWTSPQTDGRYPVSWHIDLPGRKLTLDVEAAFDEQELETPKSTGVSYWEGSVRARGTIKGKPIAGRGYLEMTGYAGKKMSEAFR